MLARQVDPKASAALSSAQAGEILTRAGAGKFIAAPGSVDIEDAYNSPISSNEAFNVLAKLMDKNASFGSLGQPIPVGKIASKHATKKPRADRWFVQPAFAAGEARVSVPNAKGGKPMNYLDAAQLVLEASSGMK
jgi:hypothetical protein